MATTTREQALSLLATANNHGDLAVKLSSLRQFKSLLLSSSSSDLTSSLASDVFPFLFELSSSPQPLVRKFLLEVIEDMGLRVLEHSSSLMPVLLALLKDEDRSVSHQSIITGTNFFCAIIQAIAWQFHCHGKIETWAEEIWPLMVAFKDAVCSLVIEPVSIKTKLLAFKYMETCVLLFTQDTDDYDRVTTGVNERRFSISWLPSGHPILDPDRMKSEANKLSSCLLDMLHSSRNLPGPVTIAIVNCLTSIARKRPEQYGRILSALLDFHMKLETSREGHFASLQYSVRSALLGFLRCTHPTIIESKDRLVKLLRSMNAGDAADQALRQVEKLMRNSERYSRDVRISKDDPPSSQPISYGDDIKKRPMSIDNEDNGTKVGSKRMRYTPNGVSPDIGPTNESRDDNPTTNETPPTVSMLDDNLNPVEQMISVISAFLAEGERGAKSLEVLVSQIHRDLLADIVISNMKNLPKNLPQVKSGSLPFNPHNSSPPDNVVQVTAPKITNMSTQSVHHTTPESTTTTPVNTSLHDVSISTNHPPDSRRDPRRDPRRLDPRRALSEAPLTASANETNVNSVLELSASVNRPASLPIAPSADIMLPQIVQDSKADDKTTSILRVSETEQETLKEEPVEESLEKNPSSVIGMSVDQPPPAIVGVDESSGALTSSETAVIGASDASLMDVSDDYSCEVSNNTGSEETCPELPQVPSFVELSQDERQSVQKMAVERIVRSYKQSKVKDLCQTRIALIARLVSWMDDDSLMSVLVQEEMVLEYRDQQGHELVMHILYHLHGLKTTESSDQFARVADLYDKFLLGVARSVLNALPASDKSFSRLLGEAPILTESVVKLLESLCCCDDSSKQQGKDIRDDRVTQGLGVVWSLILGRPLYRPTCLDIALKCAVHTEDDIRARAIRLVANKLYPLEYISGTIEQYSTNMLLSAVDPTPDADASHSVRELTGEDASVSASSVGGVVNVEQCAAQNVVSVSFSEAQRLISLYFALCTKKPCLLQLLFDVYARFGKSAKRAIHRHVPILLRALGSSYSELFRIISDPPTGSENLIALVLQILAEQGTPSPDLISTVKNLYETKFKDAAILIPILSSFSKDEVLPIFPRLVELPLDKFQEALAHVLRGTAHTGPALTPAEVLVAIHDIVPEKEGMALKKVMDACSACFEQRTVFTQHVLAKALNQMVDRTPLPLLFMRTVIQAIDAFPSLVDFVMEILSKLVNRQIWKLPKLWVGFLKCVSQTQPHSFRVLLQLPTPQLESAVNKYANLKGPLTSYASQPSIRSSLPRSTLSVLGLANEPHLTQHMGSQMRTSEASSVHGAMPT